ncbi:hypothetical protein E3N88_09507 [Mikania micrantha]|uniref:Uncharacterized protein n=1 Tax=Mikania micrantha TaxID=192012 RepID=A0A5N6PL75_9ASTR|nr:hypothetical protein E3N88_09507 [Mikania micrantha]
MDCPESRNEVSVENGKKWSSRYAMEKLRVLRGTRCLKISEISPESSASTTPPPPSKNSSSNTSNLCFKASGTFISYPGTLIRVQIIFSSAGIRQNRITLLAPVASVLIPL